ncbi:keratin, type I cytoskeletal 19-like [Pristis pectinata]|uniref:keratin, type I cytoskeletal 19-like n=1 Tax=Pristis pectinata TaxID=685728 RepID=UPI00223D9A05|nr:keratin, type I cytoskeletal 19-like [Pristis pectinata]
MSSQYTRGSSRTLGSRSLSGTGSGMRAGSLHGLGSSRISTAGRAISYGMGASLGMGSSMAFSSGGAFSSSSSSSIVANEKQTMQDLNDRLAAYLQKVQSLERFNNELELQIKEFYQQAGPVARDYSAYWATINGLRAQINDLILANSGIMLQIDNSKLAAEDFKNKFETELAIRTSVENDINGLRTTLDNLTLEKSQLETEIENLKEELIYIRKNHEDELKSLRGQVSGNVSVSVKAEPSVDLTKTLEEIRKRYEELIGKNRQEAEDWYKQQFESIQQEIRVNVGALDVEKGQLSQLRHTCQGLETELQTLQSIIASLEGNLNEIDLRYSDERGKLQATINGLQLNLSELHNKLQAMGENYRGLLNIKSKLEAELATYRRLLGGYGGQSSSIQTSTGQASTIQKTSDIKKTVVKEENRPVISTKTKTFTLVEEVVNGKVVSSRMEEVETS